MREIRRQVRRDRGGPAARQAHGEDHRRVLPADRRGRPQLQHPPLARGRGRGGLSGGDHRLDGLPAAPGAAGVRGLLRHRARRAAQAGRGPRRAGIYRARRSTACAARSATCRTSCRTSSSCARLAAPYFHSRLDGGEGDMLVGKAHLGAPEEEGPHDLRAVAVLLHAEHHEHRRHVGRARQASRTCSTRRSRSRATPRCTRCRAAR